MELTLEEAIALFIQIIVGDIVHQDYDHVVSKARLYKQLITGKDIEELMIQFNPREDAIMFEQRKRITQVITPAVASSIMKPFYKVPRTDRVVKKVSATDSEKDSKAVEEVLEKMDSFYGSEANVNGLDYFLQQRFIELTFSDPNAFIVTEFEEFNAVTEKATPYPWEVSSEMARWFQYVNNVLKVLVSREPLQYEDSLTAQEMKAFKKSNPRVVPVPTTVTKDGHKWTMYTPLYAIVFEQVDKSTRPVSEDDENYDPNQLVKTLSTGTYKVSIYEHNAGKVPAKRVGYKRDLERDGRTFVNPFDDALCYFIDSVKTVSEFSLTKSQHTFPQKLQYVPECPGESDTNGCFKGRAALGGICKVCKGSGTMPVHTSAQDVITFKMPDDPANMMDLNKVMVYMSPPVELIKLQHELVKQVKIDCHQTVFNSTVLLKDTTGQAATAETATSKNFDMDSINDTLAPFGENYSSFWLFEGDLIARFTDNEGKVEFIHRFPADFKMKTIGDLYTEMQTANDSYAPTFLIELINDDIAATKFQDDPDQLLKYDVKKRLNPFRGMTEAMVTNTLNTDYTPLWKKILYVNFEDVLSQAEGENNDFYVDDYDKQITQVRAIVDAMIVEINESKAKVSLTPIGGPAEGTAIYEAGDTVTVAPGQEQDPSHAGVSFTVSSVTPAGDSFNYALTNADGSITATYSEDALQ